MSMIITIDGPAGTGKSTIAKGVAEALNFVYFDTGAMYRAVTYCLMRADVDVSDDEAIATLLQRFSFDIRVVEKKKHYFVGDEDVTKAIRTSEVTALVSEVSANAKVRECLVEIQRRAAQGVDAVFEGRDMGTVVFPNAELKIYLTARPEVRAERRHKELTTDHPTLPMQKVLDDINRRDTYDSTRKTSPLQQAKDAHLVDTSDLTIEEVIAAVQTLLKERK